jgi:transcriptional regulator with XRE-family HTH domain
MVAERTAAEIVAGAAKRFGREVKRRRTALELSRAQLGVRAGYGAGVIARIEEGRGWIPREMADHIALALNVKRTAIMFRKRGRK